jgi:hypothetical protein
MPGIIAIAIIIIVRALKRRGGEREREIKGGFTHTHPRVMNTKPESLREKRVKNSRISQSEKWYKISDGGHRA